MAYTMAVDDIVETKTAVQAPNQQLGLNIRHWHVRSITGGSATLKDFATTLDAALAPLYALYLGTANFYYGVAAQRIFPLPKTDREVHITSGAGTIVSDNLPTQVTGIITLRTGIAGRKYRGRIYLPFPPKASLDTDNTPAAGYVAKFDNIAAIYGTLLITTGVGTASLDPVIWHRASSTYDVITNAKAEKEFATQRRRGDFGNKNVAAPF